MDKVALTQQHVSTHGIQVHHEMVLVVEDLKQSENSKLIHPNTYKTHTKTYVNTNRPNVEKLCNVEY